MVKIVKRIAVIGLGFGDEGKGKIVKLLSRSADIVVRYQGGGNAGHTNEDERGRIVSHQIPDGIFHEGYNAYLFGTLFNPTMAVGEIIEFRERGYEVSPKTYGISELAHVTLDYHLEEEKIAESGLTKIGTTLRGITQTTSAKINRLGIRFCEFLEEDSFKQILPIIIEEYDKKGIKVNLDDYLKKYKEAQKFLAPFAVKDEDIIEKYKDKKWIFGGAQAGMIDMDLGHYPFITTSNPGRKGIPFKDEYLLGVIKAITSSVGERPKITQIDKETQEMFRGKKGEVDAEFGATSGRPRQLLWPDFIWQKYSVKINEADGIAITKFDKLNLVEKIKFCTAYELDGKEIDYLPHDRVKLKRCKPIYEELDSFDQDLSNVRNNNELCKNAKIILEYWEDNLETKIDLLSTGTKEEQVIIRDKRSKLYNFMKN